MQCNAVKCSLNLLSSFKSFDSTLKSNCHNPVCIHRPFYIFLREHSAFEFVLAAANEFGWISFGGNGSAETRSGNNLLILRSRSQSGSGSDESFVGELRLGIPSLPHQPAPGQVTPTLRHGRRYDWKLE